MGKLLPLSVPPLLSGLTDAGVMIDHKGEPFPATVTEFCLILKASVIESRNWRLFALSNLGFVFVDNFLPHLRVYLDIGAVTGQSLATTLKMIDAAPAGVTLFVQHQGWNDVSFNTVEECRQFLLTIYGMASEANRETLTRIVSSNDVRADIVAGIAAKQDFELDEKTTDLWRLRGIYGPHNIVDSEGRHIWAHPGVRQYVGDSWVAETAKGSNLKAATTAYKFRMGDAYLDAIRNDKITAEDVTTTFRTNDTSTRLTYTRVVMPMRRRGHRIAVGLLWKQTNVFKAYNIKK